MSPQWQNPCHAIQLQYCGSSEQVIEVICRMLWPFESFSFVMRDSKDPFDSARRIFGNNFLEEVFRHQRPMNIMSLPEILRAQEFTCPLEGNNRGLCAKPDLPLTEAIWSRGTALLISIGLSCRVCSDPPVKTASTPSSLTKVTNPKPRGRLLS